MSAHARSSQEAPETCRANWQCRDAQVETLDWCHEGRCQHLDRASVQCQVPKNEPGCWTDAQCFDADPSTVTWCSDYDWRLLIRWGDRAPGRCHVAPRSGAQCGSAAETLVPVDVGYFARAQLSDNGQVIQSFHFESPSQEHKSMPVGNRNIDNDFLGTGNVETRAYSVWDVSGIDNAVSAKFRIWGWQPALANNFSGAYTSEDPSETIGLFSVDSHAAQELINAPFGDESNHEIDVPIFEDLGEGTLYGERVYTLDDELVDLVPSFRADPDTVCDPVVQDPGAPCGKWLEYELNADAIAAINATDGLWSMGHAMTTIGPNPKQKEWTNNGIIIDMSPEKGSYPLYLSPEPQLVIETGS